MRGPFAVVLYSFIILLYVSRVTDEVFQTLEDNQVTLSTMKASRYVKPFEQEVRFLLTRFTKLCKALVSVTIDVIFCYKFNSC